MRSVQAHRKGHWTGAAMSKHGENISRRLGASKSLLMPASVSKKTQLSNWPSSSPARMHCREQSEGLSPYMKSTSRQRRLIDLFSAFGWNSQANLIHTCNSLDMIRGWQRKGLNIRVRL